ncbi:MAG: MATE family efflux transporter [Deltaproteobacteria bacterium]|nr:MATE family efflux transporter [Deltaproteobacteria bacterium]
MLPATYRKLVSLAWPIVLARATQSVVGFSDALMVAPLGEAPLAAVTTGAMNTFALIILPLGTVFILQSFAAQLRGRGDLAAVRRYAFYGLLLAAFAELLAIATIPLVPWVLARFRYEPAVHDAMATYMRIRLLSVGVAVGAEALGNWYGGLGNTRIAMITGIVTMVSNVGLNWLLIEPRFGLPGYGVAGAAWASTIAGTLGFLVVLSIFAAGIGLEEATRGPRGELRARELRRVLRFGLPNGVNWFLEFAAFILFINVAVAHLGTTVLAAFNVVMQLNSISFMPAFGVASAGAILVGEAIGKDAKDEVWPIVRRTGVTACAWMVTVGALYLVAPARLIALFRPRDLPAEVLVATGTTMLMMSALWQLFDGLGLTLGEALRAAGDTTWCMFARILLAWAVFTPLAWTAILVLGGGVVTLMIALIIYIALLAGAFAWRFASGRWRSIEMVETEPVGI